MRKYLAAAGLTVALMIPAAGSSAVLTKGAGVGCPDGQQATFAFTVNQTTSTEPGLSRRPLTVERSGRSARPS